MVERCLGCFVSSAVTGWWTSVRAGVLCGRRRWLSPPLVVVRRRLTVGRGIGRRVRAAASADRVAERAGPAMENGTCEKGELDARMEDNVGGRFHRPEAAVKRSKRNVALWFGYVGTEYRGSQVNLAVPAAEGQASESVALTPPSSDHNGTDAAARMRALATDTVEAQLGRAFYHGGTVSDANAFDWNKMHWSRASRTDKGVHAAANVMSAKLLLDHETDLTSTNELSDAWLQRLNEQLPPSIRILGGRRASKHFRARYCCSMREYEYLIPRWVLAGNEDVFLEVLRLFEGTHRFHNFSGRERKRSSGWFIKHGRTLPDEEEGEEGEEGDDEGDGQHRGRVANENGAASVHGEALPAYQHAREAIQEVHSETTADGASPPVQHNDAHSFEVGEPEHRPNVTQVAYPVAHPERLRSSYYMRTLFSFAMEACPAPDAAASSAAPPYWIVRVIGQSFVLHQIRLMLGAAVSVARGLLPLEAVRASLNGPFRVQYRRVPGSGLLLARATFWDAKAERYRLESTATIERRVDAFKRNVLYPHIYPLTDQEWRVHLDEQAGGQVAYQNVQTLLRQYDRWRTRMEQAARERMARAPAAPASMKAEPRGTRSMLPRGLQTALALRHRLLPGPQLCHVRHQLWGAVADGRLPSRPSLDECMAYYEQHLRDAEEAARS
ncbi:hypothetical protein CDCA_CDCA12G3533 [Cyanidium caldarium]|uniref:Pseudouridine synthase I TruA alpha/beta domain-containing protein n=1 Tax=Cyanidium caldarium TaxID=2771 RepID=A0AAV9IYV1_CYACA|nr:hypothetical protein CDCA_CDCA12G3533 [Cyanidium caldarium]